MAPSYKLYYFNAMALAEPIRLVLARAKVEYEDVRFERDEWPVKKQTLPWGKVPVLELQDGKFINQSSAIIRYLAKQHNMIGASDLESAKCDEYAGAVNDLKQECMKYFHNCPTDEIKAETKRKILEEIFPEYCRNFLTIISKNGSGYLVGEKLTYADIVLAFMIGHIRKQLDANLLSSFPEMSKYEEFINGHDGIKEWIAKRPNTPF